jgi:hypothetical protein
LRNQGGDAPCTGCRKSGACGVGTCNANWGDCDKSATSGCEANLLTDNLNCGACGNACQKWNTIGTCTNGTCGSYQCKPGFKDCDGNPADGFGAGGRCGSAFVNDGTWERFIMHRND